MQKNAKINANIYETMRKAPLFFVKFYERISRDYKGDEYRYSEWRSVDRNVEICFPVSGFGQPRLEYCLCIIDINDTDKYRKEGNTEENLVDMYFHDASTSSDTDWQTILNNCIARSEDKEDKYAFVELLWFIDKQWIDVKALSGVIRKYDSRVTPFILEIFRRVCRCLSLGKQELINSLFSSLGERYEIYMPPIITDAFHLCKSSLNMRNVNLFQLVDEVIGHNSLTSLYEAEVGSNNPLLQLKCWFHSENALSDYNILKSVYSMVAEPIRLEIVKRYFHDIRLGNTTFDIELLMQFRDNRFDEFIRYRYATETPTERIVQTVPLLCDSILTLHNSKGKAFQTFDGVLDFAMTHCDKVRPGIDFKFDRFIPTCEHGAIYNSSNFKGFIDYQLVCKINQSSLTDTNLCECICELLDCYGYRQSYSVCNVDGSKIDKDSKCLKGIVCRKDQTKRIGFKCYTMKFYDDKWFVELNASNVIVLNSFLTERVVAKEHIEMSVDFSMVSVDVLRNYILSLPSTFEELGNEEFIVHSYKVRTYQLKLLEKFSNILRMRIFPQKGALVGTKFDVFGYWKEQIKTLSPEQLILKNRSQEYKVAFERYKAKEIEEVNRRVVGSLKKELNMQEYNGSFFEVAYNRDALVKIINKYYFKESFKDGDDISKHEFLTPSYVVEGFRPYCAPKLSEAKNQAIDLPFFWCRGKECFHNNLEKQTLSETNDWRKYSIYHLIEIIGYPKIHPTTIAGYEPDPVVWNFIAVTNKAMQKFSRLKCRSCGHLMFTDKSSGFNRHNYYSCINPTCSEAGNPVYLNFCFKCKKGLIDSRDTKQCPNGWYICPSCLSCCDNAQYNRQAQRYILSNRQVPNRINQMLGRGHNDKGEYFCPNCGGLTELKQDEYGDDFRSCTKCQWKQR